MNATAVTSAQASEGIGEIDDRVLVEQTALLCRYTMAPLVGTVFGGGLLCWLLAQSHGWEKSGMWYALLLLCTALRAVTGWRYLAQPRTAGETRRWLGVILGLTFLAGSTWSLSGTWLLPTDQMREWLVLFMLFFTAAVGMGSLAPVRNAYAALLVPMILPLSINQFLIGGIDHVVMSLAGPLYIVVILIICRRQTGTLERLLRLSFEKEILAASLLQERDTVKRINLDLELHSVNLVGLNRELESLAYTIAHDLRAPLRAINGHASILADGNTGRLDAEGLRCVQIIRDRTLHMARLIDDLLVVARLGRQGLEMRQVDMTALANKAAHGILESYGLTHQVSLTIDPLPPSVGDPSMLLQLWSNLIDNAVKYSGKRDKPAVVITGRVDGGNAEYTVTDNGTGFDMSYYDQLFGVFKRLHRSDEYPGTGVGLAIVHRIVSRHGGRVWARAEVGKGASFSFSLPLAVMQG